jgi:glycosyltransferase involved in cell wall biosynthesis
VIVMNESKKRVLIGSPIHQKTIILREFLSSLYRLKHENMECGYLFIDDNQDERSSKLLSDISKIVDHVTIQPTHRHNDYVRNETTHFWNEQLIWKVAEFKNAIIQHAIEEKYDYLFLVDSDLLLHPRTIEQLITMDKDIISEIFWTKWQPNSAPQPQVWLRDEYTQWEQKRGEQLSDEEISNRYEQFIAQLKVPGVYEVGGLGACTLISRRAMTSGVNFKPIKNLSFWGEDRHFCVRAAALGFSLYVDTHLPAYHLYRDSDLDDIMSFKHEEAEGNLLPEITLISNCTNRTNTHATNNSSPKLTLTMVVKNEGNRYLTQVLEEHRKYIDEAVIIDDGSTDHTVDVCLELLQGIPIRLVKNKVSMFSNEIELRKQQWRETLATDPEWILNLDADEVFEKQFAQEIHQLLQKTDVDAFCFRLYDFWNDSHYREDQLWRSHLIYRPFLVRYKHDFVYRWKETPQHCGRFPENIFELPHHLSELRLKHLGWANPEHRLEKYQRYLMLDPEARYGWKEQYLSILDEKPNLNPWIE